MTPLVITIPGPMRGKGRPRFGNGRAFTDDKTVGAENWVKLCAIQQIGQPALEGALSVAMTVGVAIPASWPRKRREDALEGRLRPTGKPDADNLLKLAADALNGIAWRDDAQIVDAFVSKRYVEQPETTITIEALS